MQRENEASIDNMGYTKEDDDELPSYDSITMRPPPPYPHYPGANVPPHYSPSLHVFFSSLLFSVYMLFRLKH